MASTVSPYVSYHDIIDVDKEEQSSIEISSDDSSHCNSSSDIIEVPESTSEAEPEDLDDMNEVEIVEDEGEFMMTSSKSTITMNCAFGVWHG